MIQTKMIELRDEATFIPAMAILMESSAPPEEKLLRRAGYWGCRCIMFGNAHGGPFRFDPYDWGDRTYHIAHLWLTEHWDEVETGDVVDVRFILKETDSPARSEAR